MLVAILTSFLFIGLHDLSVYKDPANELKPSNPFLHDQTPEPHSLLEVALEILQTITCRKGPSNISSVLVLFSLLFHLSDIVARIDLFHIYMTFR